MGIPGNVNCTRTAELCCFRDPGFIFPGGESFQQRCAITSTGTLTPCHKAEQAIVTLSLVITEWRPTCQCAAVSRECYCCSYDRVRSFFLEMAARHVGQRILVVTHGGVLDDLFRLVR